MARLSQPRLFVGKKRLGLAASRASERLRAPLVTSRTRCRGETRPETTGPDQNTGCLKPPKFRWFACRGVRHAERGTKGEAPRRDVPYPSANQIAAAVAGRRRLKPEGRPNEARQPIACRHRDVATTWLSQSRPYPSANGIPRRPRRRAGAILRRNARSSDVRASSGCARRSACRWPKRDRPCSLRADGSAGRRCSSPF
jgi:hypothetical protein